MVKQQATPAYEAACGLAVKHGKMSEGRREELLAKIARVASNDATAFAGTESDIAVSQGGASGDIAIDVVAHWIISNEDQSDEMMIHYAAAVGTIKNASVQNQDKCKTFMQRILANTLKGLNLPGGQQELDQVQQNLTALGLMKMESIIHSNE